MRPSKRSESASKPQRNRSEAGPDLALAGPAQGGGMCWAPAPGPARVYKPLTPPLSLAPAIQRLRRPPFNCFQWLWGRGELRLYGVACVARISPITLDSGFVNSDL